MTPGLRMAENRWVEPLMAVLVAAGLSYAIYSLVVYHTLPQPYFFEPQDTWMDWFNTAFWARDKGAYDSWNSLYPPLSFVFLRLVGINSCYPANEGLTSRDCDWLGVVVLHAWYLLNVFLIAKALYKIDRNTMPWRTFALGFGLPMTEGWERGNLILVGFTCVLLAHGPLVRSARLRWIFAGLAVNFKIYLIASIVPYALIRRWRWFEGAMASVIIVWIITWAIVGAGSPLELYNNIAEYTGAWRATGFIDIWYATTYQYVLSLLDSSSFPILAVLGSRRIEFLLFALPLAVHITQAMIVMASVATWLRPEVVPKFRIVALVTTLPMITQEPSGYAQIIIILFTFFERWQGIGRRWAILACYILCIPYDIYLDPLNPQLKPGFLNGQYVYYEFWISLGPFIRPGLILTIPFALSCVTLRSVWIDIRTQGWKGRNRFRFDYPLFRNGGRKTAPNVIAPEVG